MPLDVGVLRILFFKGMLPVRFYVRILILLALSVLLPCIAVFSVTNYFTFSQYQDAVSNSQVDQLQAANSTNTLVLQNMEQNALRFSLDPSVQSLGDLRRLNFGPGHSEYLVSLMRTQRMLSELVGTNPLLQSAYLYIEDSDYVISSRDSVVNLEKFADRAWMQRYAQLAENRRTSRMLASRAVPAGFRASEESAAYGRNCLTYVYPITPFTSTFHGALVFNIYEDKLLERYTGESQGSSLALFDHEGQWLTETASMNSSNTAQGQEWQLALASDSPSNGYFFSKTAQGRLQCTYSWSQDRRYVLLAVRDIDALMQKTTAFQVAFVVFLLLFIPVVALLVMAVSRRLYSPVGKLIKELDAGGKLTVVEGKDTMSAVARAVNELLREDRRLFSDRGREKLRDASVLRILAGHESAEEDEDIHTILPYSRTVCAVCEPDTQLTHRGADDNYDSRIRLLLRLIEAEILCEGMRATAIRYAENMLVILLSVDEGVQDLEQNLLVRFEAVSMEARAVMGDTVTFAVGGLSEELAGVRQGFEQAKSVLQYRFVYGLGSVLFYDRIAPKLSHYNADKRLEYIQYCLCHGQKEEVHSGISDLIQGLASAENVSYICVSQTLNQLLSGLIQYALEQDVFLEEIMEENTPIYQRLWQNRTLGEACVWLQKLFSTVMDYQNVGDAPSGEHMGKIIEYVRENYCKDITIDSIAAYIGISYSYLRKLFKEATGRNLADYIGELRIQRSKQLLCETNYTIKAIAQMCGFNHERSFSRAFTQSEGVSPGKYKAMHKPGDDNKPLGENAEEQE